MIKRQNNPTSVDPKTPQVGSTPPSAMLTRKQQTATNDKPNGLGAINAALASQNSARNNNNQTQDEVQNETPARDTVGNTEQHGFSFVSVSPT